MEHMQGGPQEDHYFNSDTVVLSSLPCRLIRVSGFCWDSRLRLWSWQHRWATPQLRCHLHHTTDVTSHTHTAAHKFRHSLGLKLNSPTTTIHYTFVTTFTIVSFKSCCAVTYSASELTDITSYSLHWEPKSQDTGPGKLLIILPTTRLITPCQC